MTGTVFNIRVFERLLATMSNGLSRLRNTYNEEEKNKGLRKEIKEK
jgi:hypothetical protein